MVDNKDFEINDTDVVVLFKRVFLEKKQQIVFMPFKVMKGNMEYTEYMFIDDNNNSYHHLYFDYPGNLFAFRRSLIDLEREYKTSDFDVIKDRYLEDINKYYYYGVRDNDDSIIIKEDKESHKLSDLDDFDFEEYDAKKNLIKSSIEGLEASNNDDKKDVSFDFVPYKLVSEIKEKVIAQDSAIEDIIVSIWNNLHLKHNHNNILIIGPTGVGKTEIFRCIASKLDIPFYKTSLANFSKAGYEGSSVKDILTGLIINCGGDISKAENAIVFLDEIDKITKHSVSDDHISSTGVQDELLTVMEDGLFNVKIGDGNNYVQLILNTKNITFVGAGAFDGLLDMCNTKHVGFGNNNTNDVKNYKAITQEHLVKYGFKPEFVARMPVIIPLNSLSKEDLIAIMKNSKNNILDDQIRVLTDMGYEVKINDDVYEEIADEAIKKKIGARGLNSAIARLFSKVLYAATNPNNRFNYIEITKETVWDPNHFKVGYKTISSKNRSSKYVLKRKINNNK